MTDDTGAAATDDIRALAAQYTGEALAALAAIMRNGKTEPARIAAAKELLDRAQSRGRAGGGDAGLAPVIEMIEQLARERQQEQQP